MITVKQLTRPLSASRSAQLAKLVPGGVNSPFRSFQEVGGHTVFFSRAQGSRLFDIDGNTYLDYLGAWGPAVLGHSHPAIISACQRILSLGPVFGAPHELELELATRLVEGIKSLEQVRFVNSGTEAVMSAIRLSRGATLRNRIIILEGGYHGHSDSVLASNRHNSSLGIPQASAEQSLLVEFNNADALAACFQSCGDEVAAVLMEPVAGSMCVIPPEPGYLQEVRRLCTKYGALLIFDEVLTGCRISLGGAQELYGVQPDLSCFGKALGGGMPIGAYGGPEILMRNLFPVGRVYQAGTFSGNPVTMTGGIETLKLLSDPGIFAELEVKSARFFAGLAQAIEQTKAPVTLQRAGSMFSIVFADHPVKNFTDSQTVDVKAYARFFHYLLDHGIYMPPSAVDAACLSAAHTDEEIDFTIDVCREAFKQVF
jgi:glutamate-1-semialdehyde 2,1-aminomutase